MISQLTVLTKILNKQSARLVQLCSRLRSFSLRQLLGKSLNKYFVIMILCLVFPSTSFSLGLGGIKLKSTLDQRLDADIEILSVTDKELNEITISLAPLAVYERMGIERTAQVEQLKFKIVNSEDGKNLIHITTPRRIREPFLNFLVEVNWASGRLLREFTVLLDPPVFLEKSAPAAVAKPETSLPPVLSTLSGASDIESTFSEAVEALTPTTSSTETALDDAPQQNSIPSASTQKQGASTASLVHDRVKQNEYLWQIAESMRPEDVSVEQMMLALKNENPAAFFGDNVSMLKAGAVLRIKDTSTLYDVSARQAIKEIEKQNQEWLAYRQERNAKRAAVAAESTNLTPVGGEAESGQNGQNSAKTIVSKAASDQPLLELVAVTDKKVDKNQSSNAALEASEEKINELNIELVMATEEIEARKHENEDLVSRLNSLEEQMSAMQSLVQLKDAELAKLRGEEVAIVDESAFKPLTVAVPEIQDTKSNSSNVTKVVSKEKAVSREEQLWQDPVTLAAAIFAILLIALTVVLIKRKSAKEESSEVANKDYAAEEKRVDELFPDDKTINDDSNFSLEDEGDSLNPMTDISLENTLFPDSEEELLDPLSEADVYLTYEKFEKAEKLLIDAIQSSPARHELKLKLLEIYAESGDADKFNMQADELYAAVGGDETHPLWKQAIVFAEAIGSDSPLFNVSSDESNKDSQQWLPDPVVALDSGEEFDASILDEIDKSERRSPILGENTVSEVDDSNSMISKPFISELESLLSEEDSKVEEDAKDGANDGIKEKEFSNNLERFDLESSGFELTEVEPFESEKANLDGHQSGNSKPEHGKPEYTKPEYTDSDLEKVMSSFAEEAFGDEDQEVNTNEASTVKVFSADTSVVNLTDKNLKSKSDSTLLDELNLFEESTLPKGEVDFSDNSLFLLSDEVATKLDLARAYIEMGDHEGASDLLTEVINEGDQRQKLEAKELMAMTAA